MVRKKKTAIILLLIFLAFGLRFYRVGVAPLKDEENNLVKTAAYVYYCQNDKNLCRHQPTGFKNRLLALITANETIPNAVAEVYPWDFIKDKASDVHQSRAWPHLYAVAAAYRILGISELSSRLVSVVAGSLLVVAGYWLSRTFGSSVNLSLLYSGLLTISFPLIDFSRNARMYSLYILFFMLLIGLIYRRRRLAAGAMFLLAYWLQMLTLILPVALLIWGIIVRRKCLAGVLVGGLILTAWLSRYFGLSFPGSQFIGLAWPPQWQYLNWWWVTALAVLAIKPRRYLLSIIGTYFLVLIFFTKPAPAAAYTIMLWPLGLWALLNWRRWLMLATALIIIFNFFTHINFLYFAGDGRPELSSAYAAIRENFAPGDKIYAVQLRDYYLQDFSEDTPVVDLQVNPSSEFSDSGFVVWEEEKTVHLKPETLEYIKTNFNYLGSNGVEIYSFGK